MDIDNLKELIERAGQLYEPPYDSPIEDILAYNLLKYIRPDVVLRRQVEVATKAGTFRLDFVLEGNGVSIGLECDGEEFHDPWRDEWRDAMILGSAKMDDILRIPGKHICGRPSICIYRIAEWYHEFFTDHGQTNIETLARAEAEAVDEAYGHPHGNLDFHGEEGKQRILGMVRLERRAQSPHYLAKLLAFAKASSHTTLDAIIEEYKSTKNGY